MLKELKYQMQQRLEKALLPLDRIFSGRVSSLPVEFCFFEVYMQTSRVPNSNFENIHW